MYHSQAPFVYESDTLESWTGVFACTRSQRACDLKGKHNLLFGCGQFFRIIADARANRPSYHVQLVKYQYELYTPAGREVLAFHWTPEADPAEMVTTPHLHIGSVNIADTAPLDPKTFNKLHIPTGYVSLQSVVRFLITDVGVQPRRADWREILEDASEPIITPARH